MLHQIGSGVLGPVFRTYDPAADQLVAVKSFRLDLIPEDVARLADALRRLVGATGYLAAGLEGASAYIAMPFHASETLDVALRHLAPAPLDVALPILRGLAGAVDAAWAAGPTFGHGALHPRDVFVAPETRDVAVTGFGVAPALEAIGASGARAPIRRPYTAPERAAGGAWDQRADVFSVAAIAHELLTGRRPAGPGEQDGALPSAWAPEVRAAVRRVLARGLAEAPAGRFATASEMIDALAAAIDRPAGQSAATLPFDAPDPGEPPPSPAAALPIRPVASLPISLAVSDPPLSATDVLAGEMSDAPKPHDEFDLASVIGEPPSRPAAAPVARPTAPVRVRAGAPPVRDRRPVPARDVAADLRLDTPFDAPPPPAPPVPAVMAAPPLPPPIPWLVVGAVAVAAAIVSGAAFYHLGLVRGRNETAVAAPSVETAPRTTTAPAPVTAAPNAPAATDTEVPVTPPAATNTAPAATSGPGRLTIRSTPPGAMVTIDGKPAGRTPVTVRGLATGTYGVVVSRPGYQSDSRRVPLTRRAPSATINATLKAERVEPRAARGGTTGSLAIETRPRGAQVSIDGKVVGLSPLSVPGLAAGAHTVRLTLAGHAPLTTTVTVRAGETARLAVTLEQR